jgi:AcrR family transcriptional regulator
MSPSVTRKKTQGNRAERRDQIRHTLLTAVEQLLEEGESFTELSVERLVSRAEISRSTFYVYFEDKGDLLSAWLSEIITELTAAAKSWWNLPDDATRDDLRAALAEIVNTYRPHTTLMAAVYDAAAYEPVLRAEVEAMMSSNIAGLRRHMREGQKNGSINPELRPEDTAPWLQWMAERGFHQLIRGAGDAEVERLTDSYADIIWFVLYAPAR